ncbi:MAG TPA: TIGR03435 family protein, partial [Candidatus Sulfopaludibacter sp.]|nr:TIGR03435 family protein [Candidatus Sulfopaludibacter sp.]
MLRTGFALTICTAAVALCQPAAPPPEFDAASIKTAQAKGAAESHGRDNVQVTPGSVTIRNTSLKGCIAWAYHVFEYQVTGPDWIGAERFDIVAKAAGPAGEAQLRLMLQTLLAQRFKMETHHVTKEQQAYVLLVGKNGPKFHESKTTGDSDIVPDQKRMSVSVQRVPMAQLVDVLSRMFQSPVVDMTGLTGRYDVTIDVAKYLPQAGDRGDPMSIIQTGLQEELGLKMEA